MSEPTLDITVQLNPDKTVQYFLYKWKGSVVKVPYGYLQDGKFVRFSIPAALNLEHWQILSILSQMYVQNAQIKITLEVPQPDLAWGVGSGVGSAIPAVTTITMINFSLIPFVNNKNKQLKLTRLLGWTQTATPTEWIIGTNPPTVPLANRFATGTVDNFDVPLNILVGQNLNSIDFLNINAQLDDCSITLEGLLV